MSAACIAVVAKEIDAKAKESGIKGTVDGRCKHIISVFIRRWSTSTKRLTRFMMLFAIRIIVDTVMECYAVHWALSTRSILLYREDLRIILRCLKQNMYQSLHNTH